MLDQNTGLKRLEKILNWLSLDENVNIYRNGDPEVFLRSQYLERVGKLPDLARPLSYNEKLQWLKLYWRDPSASLCANKFTARNHVKKCGYAHMLHPLLAVWNSEEEIDFSDLPDSFIIKAAHASGLNLIVQDKHTLPFHQTKKTLGAVLRVPYYAAKMEWVYETGPACLLCEELFPENHGAPLDYKFLCFNGVVKAVEILTVTDMIGLRDEPRSYFCNENLERLPVRYGYLPLGGFPKKPDCYEEMKAAAAAMSIGFPHVRVDFCVSQERAWFGEFTFFPGAGFDTFDPEGFALEMGSWIQLPTNNTKRDLYEEQ